jgi:protein-S-isoprenylcysteine O-methyltransferase Ste14
MNKGNIVALSHALSGAGAMFVGFLTRGRIGVAEDVLKVLGYSAFAFGMLLFAYSVAFLREAFQGNVEPVTDTLIVDGPYRWVRHPLYLSMIITITGISIGMRSVWGLVITFLVFIPLTLVRSGMEEDYLEKKFGSDWDEYVRNTHFIIPLIY